MINKIKELLIKYKSIIAYLIVGGLTTLVDLVVFYINSQVFGMNYLLNKCIAWVAAVSFAYFPNKYIVFESKEKKKGGAEFVKFFGSRITTLLISLVVMFLLVDIININEVIANFMVQFINIVLNYLFSKLFVFKK